MRGNIEIYAPPPISLREISAIHFFNLEIRWQHSHLFLRWSYRFCSYRCCFCISPLCTMLVSHRHIRLGRLDIKCKKIREGRMLRVSSLIVLLCFLLFSRISSTYSTLKQAPSFLHPRNHHLGSPSFVAQLLDDVYTLNSSNTVLTRYNGQVVLSSAPPHTITSLIIPPTSISSLSWSSFPILGAPLCCPRVGNSSSPDDQQ